MTQPFLKWCGGKKQLADTLLPLILERLAPGGAYIEPFLGGGAVALRIDRETPVRASDACPPLVETWQMVAAQTYALSRLLEQLRDGHSADQYYAVRAEMPDGPVGRAARFIYLNKTGFNGLYRTNRAGLFNVPLGRGRATSIPTYGELMAVASVVREWTIGLLDFERAIDRAGAGDVVYADPPYDGTFAYSSGFGDVARVRLASSLRRAARRGVGVVVTDADTPLVRRLYAWADVRSIDERRSVAASSSSRDDASCIVAVRP